MEHLNQAFIEAGTLMIAGMVFVFAFLGLLIVFVNTVLVSLSRKYPDVVAQTSAPKAVKSNNNQKTDSIPPGVIAAISSAVNSYREKHNLS